MPGTQATREYERLHSKSVQMLAEDDLDEDTQAAIRRISAPSRRRLLATGEGKELSKKRDDIINRDGTFSMHARIHARKHAHCCMFGAVFHHGSCCVPFGVFRNVICLGRAMSREA